MVWIVHHISRTDTLFCHWECKIRHHSSYTARAKWDHIFWCYTESSTFAIHANASYELMCHTRIIPLACWALLQAFVWQGVRFTVRRAVDEGEAECNQTYEAHKHTAHTGMYEHARLFGWLTVESEKRTRMIEVVHKRGNEYRELLERRQIRRATEGDEHRVHRLANVDSYKCGNI